MNEENFSYLIWIDKTPVPVTESVYREYWRGIRKERYFSESDMHNKTFYYNALDTEETNGSDIFCDEASLPVEDKAIENLEISRLKTVLNELSKEEYELIYRLYFNGESLRAVSKEKGISLSTLHYRHKKILKKLKKLIENPQ